MALAIGLNVRHALNDYGVKNGKLHVEVLAQASGSGGGSGTDTGTGTGTGNTGDCKDLPNNSNGGNIFFYCNKEGKPENCTLKKYISVNLGVKWAEDSPGGDFTFAGETSSGIKELCPKTGNGCTVYSCQKTN